MTDIFLSDGGSKYPALKFENVNDTHTGTVIEVKKLEDRDPAGTVKTWDNGDVGIERTPNRPLRYPTCRTYLARRKHDNPRPKERYCVS